MTEHKGAQIGFVGLGAMGFGMATHLVKQGYNVKGFDVFPKSVERFREAGGVPARSLEDSAKDAEFYVVMVATAVQAQDALFDNKQAIIPALPKNATLLLASTVPSSYAQSVASQLTSLNRTDISFIDCPVSGGAVRAAAGTLSLMVGASDSAIQKGKWLLQELSDTNKLFIVPGGVGQGSNLKMLHQVLAGIQILATSEAMGFAAKLGLDAKEVRERVIGSESWSWMFENRSTRILTEDYYPGVSALTIILKDVGIITSQSRLRAFPTPLITAAEQAYLAGLALGYGAQDDSGMIRLYFSSPVSSVIANYTSTATTAPSNASEAKSADTNVEGDKEAKIKLVLNLLRYIHIVAAAEAIAYARFLEIDLDMFYELCNDAAGGSRMFKIKGGKMIAGLKSATGIMNLQSLVSSITGAVSANDGGVAGESMDDAIRALSGVCQTARDKNCPLYVGSAALNVFLMAKRRAGGSAADHTVIDNWNV